MLLLAGNRAGTGRSAAAQPEIRPLSKGTVKFYNTTVGKKMVMALTGFILFLFIVFHLMGNLLVFWGPRELNAYSATLHSVPEWLWLARFTLLAALILHIVAAVQLTLTNWAARPVSYVMRIDVQTDYAARTMIVSGPLILIYAVYHLLMFTFLVTGPGYSSTDVYANVVSAFQARLIAAIYITAMLMLGIHLYHGLWSMLHTAGISSPHYRRLRYILAPVVAVGITVGYIAIPVAILSGIVH